MPLPGNDVTEEVIAGVAANTDAGGATSTAAATAITTPSGLPDLWIIRSLLVLRSATGSITKNHPVPASFSLYSRDLRGIQQQPWTIRVTTAKLLHS